MTIELEKMWIYSSLLWLFSEWK